MYTNVCTISEHSNCFINVINILFCVNASSTIFYSSSGALKSLRKPLQTWWETTYCVRFWLTLLSITILILFCITDRSFRTITLNSFRPALNERTDHPPATQSGVHSWENRTVVSWADAPPAVCYTLDSRLGPIVRGECRRRRLQGWSSPAETEHD